MKHVLLWKPAAMLFLLMVVAAMTPPIVSSASYGLTIENSAESENLTTTGYGFTVPDGLVGYWRFDEGIGTTASDSSDLGAHGTIHEATWTDGKIGNALQFDGIRSSYVLVPDMQEHNFTSSSSFTLAAWIRASSKKLQMIIDKSAFVNPENKFGYTLGLWEGKVWLQCGFSTIESVTNVIDYNWHFVAATYENGEMKLYVDGVLEASGTFGFDAPLESNVPLSIGALVHVVDLYFFYGVIDEVRIYNRALDAEEINEIMGGPFFALSVSPSNGTVFRGGSTNATVSVESSDNHDRQVGLSVATDNLPAGVSVNFSPPSGTPPFDSTMTISTTQDAPAGTHAITITGTDNDGRVYACTFELTVILGDFTITLSPTSGEITRRLEWKVDVMRYEQTGTEQENIYYADVYHWEQTGSRWVWGDWEYSSSYQRSGRGWLAALTYYLWPTGWRQISDNEARDYKKSYSRTPAGTLYTWGYDTHTRSGRWEPIYGWVFKGRENFSSYPGSNSEWDYRNVTAETITIPVYDWVLIENDRVVSDEDYQLHKDEPESPIVGDVRYVNGGQMWVSDQLDVVVTLEGENGFEGDVTLGVEAPSSIQPWFEDEVLHVSSSVSTILHITVPSSDQSMLGTYPLFISAVSDVSREPTEDEDYSYYHLEGSWHCGYCDYTCYAPPWDRSAIVDHVKTHHPDELLMRKSTTYEVKAIPDYTWILALYLLNVPRYYHPYFGGRTAEAYYIGQHPSLQVDVQNPYGVGLRSEASVEGPTDDAGLSSSVGGTYQFTHDFGSLMEIGRYNLDERVYLQDSSTEVDSDSAEFYAVFEQQNDVENRHYNDTFTKHDGFPWDWTQLHPFSREIIDFTFAPEYISRRGRLETNNVPGSGSRREAAEQLAYLTGRYINYEADNADHWDDFTILNLNGQNPAGHAAGDCSDFTAAYLSCTRSIGLPVRPVYSSFEEFRTATVFVEAQHSILSYYYYHEDFTVRVRYNSLKDIWEAELLGVDGRVTSVQEVGMVSPGVYRVRVEVEYWKSMGHAFNEVYLNGEWVHAEPQGSFDDPNHYLSWGRNFEYSIEDPGWFGLRYLHPDVFRTVKYSIGLKPPASVNVYVNASGNGENQVPFVNLAKSGWFVPDYTAKNFSVEVIDNGGLNLSLGQLVGNSTLSPGEEDHATLRVWGAEPCPYWDQYEVQLRLTYTTVNGEVCSKESLLSVDVD